MENMEAEQLNYPGNGRRQKSMQEGGSASNLKNKKGFAQQIKGVASWHFRKGKGVWESIEATNPVTHQALLAVCQEGQEIDGEDSV